MRAPKKASNDVREKPDAKSKHDAVAVAIQQPGKDIPASVIGSQPIDRAGGAGELIHSLNCSHKDPKGIMRPYSPIPFI